MNSLQWIELYNVFEKFAAQAKKQRFYVETIDNMEQSLYEMCPMPKSWRNDCKKNEGHR